MILKLSYLFYYGIGYLLFISTARRHCIAMIQTNKKINKRREESTKWLIMTIYVIDNEGFILCLEMHRQLEILE